VPKATAICEKLGLLGFVVLGDHGIKGVLCGPMQEITLYVQAMAADRIFQGTKMRCISRKKHHDLTVKETRFLTHKQSSDLLRISQQCGCGVGLALPEEIRWLATDKPEKLPQEEMDRLHIGTFGHHEGIYGPNQN
jgi:predicted sulfurtransferase